MIGEILYFAHKHFRVIFVIATLTVLVLAGLGLLDSQTV